MTATRWHFHISFAVLILICFSGCRVSAQETSEYTPEYDYPINSKDRAAPCMAEYLDGSGRFAKCLSGEVMLRNEACKNGFKLLGTSFMSEWQKAAVLETLRNNHCI